MDQELDLNPEDFADPSILDDVLQDFDWDNIEISGDFLQTIVPTDFKNMEISTADVIIASSTAGAIRAEDVIAPTTGRKHGREQEYDEEEENIKFMRSGSLGRIIASTIAAITPPRSPSRRISETSIDPASRAERDEKRKKIVLNLLQTFNLGDLGRLALFIREYCFDSCQLETPDLPVPIVGLGDITIYFSLLVEIYPDGVYRVFSSLINRNSVSVSYSFVGRRIFEQPVESLFRQVQMHAMRDHRHFAKPHQPQRIHEEEEEVILGGGGHGSEREEGVINIKKLNSNGWARRLNQSQVQPALIGPSLAAAAAASAATSAASSSISAAASAAATVGGGLAAAGSNSSVSSPATAAASATTTPARLRSSSNSASGSSVPTSVFQRITEVLNNLIVPNAGMAAADVLKKVPLKLKRQIVLEFNTENQIVRMTILNIT